MKRNLLHLAAAVSTFVAAATLFLAALGPPPGIAPHHGKRANHWTAQRRGKTDEELEAEVEREFPG